jgi:hypothetical protein
VLPTPTCDFALHALQNSTLTDRIGGWSAQFVAGAYSSKTPNAVMLDGSTGYARFIGAGFLGSQAAFVVRTHAAREAAGAGAATRALLAVAAQGLGTITITHVGGVFGLSMTLL